jgi:putative glutamine amidotransferase
MPRPLIGICAAIEQARYGAWDELTAMVPRSYPDAVQRAGAIAVLLPPDGLSAKDPGELLDRLDGLVISGGTDVDPTTHGSEPHPETKGTNVDRDHFEVALCRDALERDMPVLGICRGMQVMNVSAGGTLEQHIPDRLGHDNHRVAMGEWAEHGVRLEPGSLAAKSAGAETLSIKSHHHQGVDVPGDGVTISGWAIGDDTVEAIEIDDRAFALGVLWHPEEDPDDRVIPSFVKRVPASPSAGTPGGRTA